MTIDRQIFNISSAASNSEIILRFYSNARVGAPPYIVIKRGDCCTNIDAPDWPTIRNLIDQWFTRCADSARVEAADKLAALDKRAESLGFEDIDHVLNTVENEPIPGDQLGDLPTLAD